MKRRTRSKSARTRRGKPLISIDYAGLARAKGSAAWWKTLASALAADVRKAIAARGRAAAATRDESCWIDHTEVKPCDPDNEGGPLCIWQYWICDSGRSYIVKVPLP